jgi:hypothetical protein
MTVPRHAVWTRRPPRLWDAVLLVMLVALLMPIVLALGVSGVLAVITLILG